LRRREVTVLARGRGAAGRPKEITMWMPGVTIRQIPLPPAPPAADPDSPPHSTNASPRQAADENPLELSARAGSTPEPTPTIPDANPISPPRPLRIVSATGPAPRAMSPVPPSGTLGSVPPSGTLGSVPPSGVSSSAPTRGTLGSVPPPVVAETAGGAGTAGAASSASGSELPALRVLSSVPSTPGSGRALAGGARRKGRRRKGKAEPGLAVPLIPVTSVGAGEGDPGAADESEDGLAAEAGAPTRAAAGEEGSVGVAGGSPAVGG
jgi:hypothetical protein